MNCKPGELCRIVGAKTTPEANDHFVTTVRLIENGYVFENGGFLDKVNNNPTWLVTGSNIPVRGNDGVLRFVSERGVGDQYLRPIRDPGDDAQDETLQWLPVPSTKEMA